MTLARAWAWIKLQPEPFRARELADAFEVSLNSGTNMLMRLRYRGAVKKSGSTWRCRWIIADPKADVSDTRGIHPHSMDNLRVNWGRTTGQGKKHDRQRKDWPGATALDQCWALNTVSIVDAHCESDTLDTRMRELRPEFDQAA